MAGQDSPQWRNWSIVRYASMVVLSLLPLAAEQVPFIARWPYHDFLWAFTAVPVLIAAYGWGIAGGTVAGITLGSGVAFWEYWEGMFRPEHWALRLSHPALALFMGANTLLAGLAFGMLSQVLKRERREIAKLNETLAHDAIHDYLTNLYNRRYLRERAAEELARAVREHRPCCVVNLDIDHFKQCNDVLGHVAGDEELVRVSRTIRKMLRLEDTCYRLGGDEFAVILPGLDKGTAAAVMERVVAVVRDGLPPSVGGKGEYCAEISFGIAEFPKDGTTVDDLGRAADDALYRAKRERSL